MSDGKTSAALLLLPYQGPGMEVKAKVMLHIAGLPLSLSQCSLFDCLYSLSHNLCLTPTHLPFISFSVSWFSFSLSCPAPLSFIHTRTVYISGFPSCSVLLPFALIRHWYLSTGQGEAVNPAILHCSCSSIMAEGQ